MQCLRNASRLTRFVLVWFALFIGVAAASPLVDADGVQLVCSAAGSVKLVQLDADGKEAQGTDPGMQCPLCLPLAAPSPVSVQTPIPVGLSHALHSAAQAPLAERMGLPWQARAPPLFVLTTAAV